LRLIDSCITQLKAQGPSRTCNESKDALPGSYLRLIDSCITQLKPQGPSRTCNESKEALPGWVARGSHRGPTPGCSTVPPSRCPPGVREREFFIDNLLIRIHCIIVMIRCTGLAPWEFEFPWCHVRWRVLDEYRCVPKNVLGTSYKYYKLLLRFSGFGFRVPLQFVVPHSCRVAPLVYPRTLFLCGVAYPLSNEYGTYKKVRALAFRQPS